MTPEEETAHFAELDRLWAAAWPAEVPRSLRYPLGQMPLSHYLTEWARRDPDRPAIIYYGSVLTYAEFDRLSDRFAALLAQSGVRKGDRVGVFLQNCPQYNIAFHGILKLGAIYTPISPMSKTFELTHQLTDSGARVLLAQDTLMPLVREARAAGLLDHVFVTSLAEMLPADPAVPVHGAIPRVTIACPDAVDLLPALATAPDSYPDNGVTLDDIASLNYTGGTTGLPKGCMHSHGNMLYSASASRSIFQRDEGHVETTLIFLPQFWIAGQNASLIGPMLHGDTQVLLSRWDPEAVLAAIGRWRVAQFTLPVDSAAEIAARPDLAHHDLSSLISVRVIGLINKLTIALRRDWQRLFGVTLIESSWGMTETHAFNSHTLGMQQDDFDLLQRRTFVGLPVAGTRFKIADFATGATLPIGTEGEICCLTPSVTKGYWQRPEASAELVRDGWLHSGDLGVIGPQGHIHYLGRRKEMIKVRGMSVFPAEVEAVLALHPAVEISGVAPRPDPVKGQVPVAFVQLRGAATPDELRAWCAERLADFKVPEIRLTTELPQTATGKVRKQVLADALAREYGEVAE